MCTSQGRVHHDAVPIRLLPFLSPGPNQKTARLNLHLPRSGHTVAGMALPTSYFLDFILLLFK